LLWAGVFRPGGQRMLWAGVSDPAVNAPVQKPGDTVAVVPGSSDPGSR